MNLTKKRNLTLILTILTYIVVARLPKTTTNLNTNYSLIALFLFFLSVILLLPRLNKDFQYIKQHKTTLWYIPLFIVLALLMDIILSLLLTAKPSNESHVESLLHNPNSLLATSMILLIAVAAPFMEEVIFQYFIQSYAKKYLRA